VCACARRWFRPASRGCRTSADTENVSRHAHRSPRARDVGNIILIRPRRRVRIPYSRNLFSFLLLFFLHRRRRRILCRTFHRLDWLGETESLFFSKKFFLHLCNPLYKFFSIQVNILTINVWVIKLTILKIFLKMALQKYKIYVGRFYSTYLL